MPRVIDLAGNIAQSAGVLASANAQRAQPGIAAFQQGANIGSNAVEQGMRRYDDLNTQALNQKQLDKEGARRDRSIGIAENQATQEAKRYENARSAAERERMATESILQTLAQRGGVSMGAPISPMPGFPFSVPGVPTSQGVTIPKDAAYASRAAQDALLQRLEQDREDQGLAQYGASVGIQFPVGADPGLSREILRGRMKLDAMTQQSLPAAQKIAESVMGWNIPEPLKKMAVEAIQADPINAHKVKDELISEVVKQTQTQAKQMLRMGNIEKQKMTLQGLLQNQSLDAKSVALLGPLVEMGVFQDDDDLGGFYKAIADIKAQTNKDGEEAQKQQAESRVAEFNAEAERLNGIISSIRAMPNYADSPDAQSLPMLEELQSKAKQKAIMAKTAKGTPSVGSVSAPGGGTPKLPPVNPGETREQYRARVKAAMGGK